MYIAKKLTKQIRKLLVTSRKEGSEKGQGRGRYRLLCIKYKNILYNTGNIAKVLQ